LSQVGTRLARTRAADLAIVAAALLRGAGHEMCPAEVLRLNCDMGALMRAVTDAFNQAGLTQPGGEAHEQPPFAGATV
jgi:hypothetical protein